MVSADADIRHAVPLGYGVARVLRCSTSASESGVTNRAAVRNNHLVKVAQVSPVLPSGERIKVRNSCFWSILSSVPGPRLPKALNP